MIKNCEHTIRYGTNVERTLRSGRATGPSARRSTPLLVLTLVATGTLTAMAGCGADPQARSMDVIATAYTMRESETKKGNVGLTAWGDQLEPGMRSIAVSRDLIDAGLHHETVVRIEGLDGEFVVRDKMNRRWEEKIDIFMGKDVEGAREWGKRDVTIYWSEDD